MVFLFDGNRFAYPSGARLPSLEGYSRILPRGRGHFPGLTDLMSAEPRRVQNFHHISHPRQPSCHRRVLNIPWSGVGVNSVSR